MTRKFAILVLALAVTISSTSAFAYGHRFHQWGYWYGYWPGYWYGYSHRYSSLPGGGMLDRGAALNGSSPGAATGGP